MSEILGGIAFLAIVAAPVLAVIALRSGTDVLAAKPRRENPSPLAIGKRIDESRTQRSFYLWNLLRLSRSE